MKPRSEPYIMKLRLLECCLELPKLQAHPNRGMERYSNVTVTMRYWRSTHQHHKASRALFTDEDRLTGLCYSLSFGHMKKRDLLLSIIKILLYFVSSVPFELIFTASLPTLTQITYAYEITCIWCLTIVTFS
jgi:hypothetical protein